MKTEFPALIESRVGGVFRCHAPFPDRALELARETLRVVPVRLVATRDKNAFLNAVAKALEFPEYFGHNWDAFYDCLLELKHGEGDGTLLILRDASGFARAEPEEFAAAADTLADAADYWKDEGKTLLVIVELKVPTLAPDLPEINYPVT